MAALDVDDVSLVYRSAKKSLVALEHLNLSVAAGEFVSVLGPSGCGKSTLLKLVSGLLAPTHGEIRLAGQRVTRPRPDVGIVFQQPTLLPWRNVIDNVLVPARAIGADLAQAKSDARALLELVGLSAFATAYPKELSGGMQQRVAIARGLLQRPSVLLMDEPFSALDAMTRDGMLDELQRIWMSARKSVLFITHSIPEAVYLSDRVLVMSGRPGTIVEEVRVDIARPRTRDTMRSATFVELTAMLRSRFDALGSELPRAAPAR